MPKLKTNRAAAKRFKKTASGHYKHRRGYRNHILTKKPAKRMLHLRAMGVLHKHAEKLVKLLLREK